MINSKLKNFGNFQNFNRLFRLYFAGVSSWCLVCAVEFDFCDFTLLLTISQ